MKNISLLFLLGMFIFAIGILWQINGDLDLSTFAIGKKIVTFDDYQQIQIGMSYRQVVAIIGVGGEELSRNQIDGIPGVMQPVATVMYQWVNGHGSNMNAMFQNNRLINKAQFGLK